jgi:hypothetical protein
MLGMEYRIGNSSLSPKEVFELQGVLERLGLNCLVY